MNKKMEKDKIIILIIDANEDLNKGKLARSFTQLGMQDLVKKITGGKGPATHFRGKNQID